MRHALNLFARILPFADFVYLLQLDEYLLGRYVGRLPRFFFRRKIQRLERLRWTGRAMLTATMAGILFLSPTLLAIIFLLSPEVMLAKWQWSVGIVAALLLSAVAVPLWVGIANILLSPLFSLAKWRQQRLAKNLLRERCPDAQVIAIAGSFGKTTTKHFLEQLLRSSFRVQMTPGTINTPSGIAQWIINDLKVGAEVILIETDGYSRAEFERTSWMICPDIVVLTTVGDQHLERFGTRQALGAALLASAAYAPQDSKILMPAATKALLQQWRIFPSERSVSVLEEVFPRNCAKVISTKSYQEGLRHLSPSNQENAHFALTVATWLGASASFLAETLPALQLPGRRQEVEKRDSFVVVDDTYNISPSTARAGLERAQALATRDGKKLVVVTGGIFELGKENAEANQDLGEQIAERAVFVVVLQTIVAKEVEGGLEQGNMPPEKISHAHSMEEAWATVLSRYTPSEVVVLLQPEGTDVHY